MGKPKPRSNSTARRRATKDPTDSTRDKQTAQARHGPSQAKTVIDKVYPSRRPSPLAVLSLLAVGALFWIVLGEGRGIGLTRWIVIGASAIIAILPPVTDFICTQLDRVRHPAPKTIWRTAMLVGLIATAYFILTAFNQDRDLFPKTHDECSYAIGMQILARGRLWMPRLPLPDFFESFYILTTPAYCSKYFPGTALLFVPTVWLHWPTWVLPAIVSGACVALVYRIVGELLDGAFGLLAALMMVSLNWFRILSVLLYSNIPMLLFALLLYWAWTKWRRGMQIRWALVMGAFAGWGAIVRPIDAIAVALPVIVAVVWQMIAGNRNHRGESSAVDGSIPAEKPSNWTSRRAFATVLMAVLGAAPFLSLQLIFNKGVTGHLTETPYGYYIDRYQPNTTYGFHALDLNATVQSTLLQKHEYYDRFVRPFIVNHRPANIARAWLHLYFPMLVDTTMQCRLLLLFIPIGLLGLTGARRWVLFAWLPLFVLFYIFSTFFLEHYGLVVAPAVIFLILMGGQVTAAAWPKWQRPIFAAFTAVVLVISLTSLWEINHLIASPDTRISDETLPSPILRYVNLSLPQREDLERPAVVLFRYHAGDDYDQEPVYNTDVAWPDSAPIIRAHDLGPQRNRAIFEYYAKTQPDRTFYLFDAMRIKEQRDPLVRLGRATRLAAEKPGSEAKPAN